MHNMPTEFKKTEFLKESKSYKQFLINTEIMDDEIEQLHRKDERKDDDVRPIYVKTGVISQANGSSYIELGNTKIICAVYGPREVAKKSEFSFHGQLYCELKFAPFSCFLRKHQQVDDDEKNLSSILCDSLQPSVCMHLFPKSQVDVFCTVLENDGSILSTCITSASIALAHAGIPLYDVVTAATLCWKKVGYLIDPTQQEEENSEGIMAVALLPSINQISTVYCDGCQNVNVVSDAVSHLLSCCLQLHAIVEECLHVTLQEEQQNNQK